MMKRGSFQQVVLQQYRIMTANETSKDIIRRNITLPTSCCRYCLTTVDCCITLSNDEYAGRLAFAFIEHEIKMAIRS